MADYLVTVQRVIEFTVARETDTPAQAQAQAITIIEAYLPRSMDGSRRSTRVLAVEACVKVPPQPEAHLRLVEGH